MASIQILQKELLSNNKYPLKNITFQKPDLDGNMHEQKHEVYFRPDAVSILLADKNEKVFLFTRQFRLPTYLNGNEYGYLLETCAGLIEDGETPEQAALREVQEETGYELSDLIKICAVYSSAGGITEYIHLFIAEFDNAAPHEPGGGAPGEGEDIEVIKMPFDEALEKLKTGAFKDAKTIILLQHYFMFMA